MGRHPGSVVNPRVAGGVVVLAVIAAGIAWFFGVDVPQALAVGGVVAAVGLTWAAVRDGAPLTWPAPPVRSEPGARRDLSETAWSLRSRGGVPERALGRARSVARHRLRTLHQLDLDDPDHRDRIEAVLPPPVVAVLSSERRPELDLAAFASVLTALEALAPPTDQTTTDHTTTERQP